MTPKIVALVLVIGLITEQIAVVVDVNVTAFPDEPPVAVTNPVVPTEIVGTAPKTMVCAAFATVMLCVACAAAL